MNRAQAGLEILGTRVLLAASIGARLTGNALKWLKKYRSRTVLVLKEAV